MSAKFKHCITIVMILCLLFMVSCDAQRRSDTEKTHITLMHGWGGSSADHVAMQRIYKAFEDENPDVKLMFDASPDIAVVIDKANDMLAADRMPDIISTNGAASFVSNAIKKKKALDLKPYIDADQTLKNDIHSATLKIWTMGNSIYTLPDALEVIGYWYNEDIFKKAGVTRDGTPDSEVSVPGSWHAFWEACEKIRQWADSKGFDIDPLAMDSYITYNYFLGARIAGESPRGAEFMSREPKHYDNSAFKAAIDDIQSAYKYCNEDTLGCSLDNARRLFLDQKAAIYFNGVWENSHFMGTGIENKVKFAAYPGYGGRTVSYVSPSAGYVIGVSDDTKKVDACIRFLKYMLRDDVQMRIALDTRQVPANPNIDFECINQQVPMMGTAIKEAYAADIQIRTIESIWDEQALYTLKNNLKRMVKRTFTSDDIINILNNAVQ